MADAPTAEQVARAQQQGQPIPGAVGTSGRAVRVESPSSQWRTYQPNDVLRVSVPANWTQIGGQGVILYAPEGGYFQSQGGGSAFTHGVEVGVVNTSEQSLQQATEALIASFTQSNPDLRRTGGYARANVGGRNGLRATLTNVSAITGQQERVTLATTQLSDGSTLFVIGVAPQTEARAYQPVFTRVLQGLSINDR
jgi:hypothetical protein